MDLPVMNYDKLKGRIKEKIGTQSKLAELMQLDEATISNKLNNNTYFTQKEIIRISAILEIEIQQIAEYFFTEKVREHE